MFKLFKLEATKKVYTKAYCEGNYEDCKRYQMRSEGHMPPDNLLPDGDYMR